MKREIFRHYERNVEKRETKRQKQKQNTNTINRDQPAAPKPAAPKDRHMSLSHPNLGPADNSDLKSKRNNIFQHELRTKRY